MSTPRYDWWPYVKGMIRRYPELCRRDRDNIAAGRKFVQDALVRCKVLQNDGWKGIAGFADDWAVDKARPRVEIVITEMG